MPGIARALAVGALVAAGLTAVAPSTAAGSAPAAAAADGPLMGVSRTTGLSGGDVVNVWAVRLPVSTTIRVIQCDWYVDPVEESGCTPTATRTSGADGRMAVKLTLADPVYRQAPFGDPDTVFCRADSCRIFLAWVDDEGNDQSISSDALRFKGSPATIAVTPSENLPRRQRVRVTGTAYGAQGRTVRVAESACYDLVQGTGCFGERPARFTTVRPDGTFSLRYPARRILANGEDCVELAASATCGLTVAVLEEDGSPDLSFSNPARGEPLAGLTFSSTG